MSEQNIKDITYIYLVSNINNEKYTVYIGKTKNLSRERDHRCRFGKNIVFNVIDEVGTYERKYWQPLETYWIEQFRSWGFKVMNIKKKGGSGVEYHTEDTKEKIRKKHLESLRRGVNHHNYGKPNTALSELNKLKVGANHPMYGKRNPGASKNSSQRVGAKNPNYGKTWITDGTRSRLLRVSEEMPVGWKRGRVKS